MAINFNDFKYDYTWTSKQVLFKTLPVTIAHASSFASVVFFDQIFNLAIKKFLPNKPEKWTRPVSIVLAGVAGTLLGLSTKAPLAKILPISAIAMAVIFGCTKWRLITASKLSELKNAPPAPAPSEPKEVDQELVKANETLKSDAKKLKEEIETLKNSQNLESNQVDLEEKNKAQEELKKSNAKNQELNRKLVKIEKKLKKTQRDNQKLVDTMVQIKNEKTLVNIGETCKTALESCEDSDTLRRIKEREKLLLNK